MKANCFDGFRREPLNLNLLLLRGAGGLLLVFITCELFSKKTFAVATASNFIPVYAKILGDISLVHFITQYQQTFAKRLARDDNNQQYRTEVFQYSHKITPAR